MPRDPQSSAPQPRLAFSRSRLRPSLSPAQRRRDLGPGTEAGGGQRVAGMKSPPSIAVWGCGRCMKASEPQGKREFSTYQAPASLYPLGSWTGLSVCTSVFPAPASAGHSISPLASLSPAPSLHSWFCSPWSSGRGLRSGFKSVAGLMNLGVKEEH